MYAGNNPVSNVDPSGQYRAASAGAGSSAHESWTQTKHRVARIVEHRGCDKMCQRLRGEEAAKGLAGANADFFHSFADNLHLATYIVGALGLAAAAFQWWFISGVLLGIAAALDALERIASNIENAFSSEARNSDSWFTKANIGQFGDNLETAIGRDVKKDGMVWLLVGLAGAAMYLARNFIAAIATLKVTVADVVNASKGLLGFALGYFITLAAGYA